MVVLVFCFMPTSEVFYKWTGNFVGRREQEGLTRSFYWDTPNANALRNFHWHPPPPSCFSIKGFFNILSGGESGVRDGRSLGSGNGGAAGICLSLSEGFLGAARRHKGQGFSFYLIHLFSILAPPRAKPLKCSVAQNDLLLLDTVPESYLGRNSTQSAKSVTLLLRLLFVF